MKKLQAGVRMTHVHYKNIAVGSWFGLLAPAGVPE